MNPTAKQTLVPLQVEWQVSPSTPFLRLHAAESASDDPTSVTFVAHFGLLNRGNSSNGIEAVKVVSAPYDAGQLSQNPGPSQIIRMTFISGMWVRMCPAFSDRDVIDPNRFNNYTKIFEYKLGQSINEWLSQFRQEWARTSVCPDPHVYEVENSLWIQEVGVSGHHHYLVAGHDAYIEVLAKGWESHSQGTLDGW